MNFTKQFPYLNHDILHLRNLAIASWNALHLSDVLMLFSCFENVQMAKEIEELTRQRDLAQSRVENLLLSVREFQMLKQGEYSPSEVTKVPCMVGYNKHSDTVAPSTPTFNNQYPGLPEKPEEDFLLDGITPKFAGLDPCKGWEEITQKMNEEFEDNCKEVRCIEIEDSSIKMNKKAQVSSLSSERNEGKSDMEEAIVKEAEADNSTAPEEEEGKGALTDPEDIEGKLTVEDSSIKKLEIDGYSTNLEENQRKLDLKENVVSSPKMEHLQSSHVYTDETYKALKRKIEELQKTVKFLVSLHHLEQSPCFSDASSSSSSMTRSRSCKAAVTTAPSPQRSEENERTSTEFGKDFIERSTNLYQKLSGLKYDNRNGDMSRRHSQTSLSISGLQQSLEDVDVEETFSELDFSSQAWKSFSGYSVRRRSSSSIDFAADGSEPELQSEKQIDDNNLVRR